MQNFSVTLKAGGHMGNPGLKWRITSDRAFDDEDKINCLISSVELLQIQ
jgi:hypothetical protein